MKQKKVNFGQSRSKTKFATGVPFIVTDHARLKAALTEIIHETLNLLCMNDKVTETFTPGPLLSFRTAQKLSTYLV